MDITSRFDGKIVKLYYEENETARVGAPLVDIEVEDDDVGKFVCGPFHASESAAAHPRANTSNAPSSRLKRRRRRCRGTARRQ